MDVKRFFLNPTNIIMAEYILRDLGISQGTIYKWKQKYGGMEASDVKRLKDLKLENSRLKRLLADTILDKYIFRA